MDDVRLGHRVAAAAALAAICGTACATGEWEFPRQDDGFEDGYRESELPPNAAGWDYNLAHRCVESTQPDAPNFYADRSDCPVPGKRWTVAIQSEASLGASCAGVSTQSLPINAGGPLTMSWSPRTDEQGRANWAVDLNTDFETKTHPCGAGFFNWYVLMDHGDNGGGPHPRPDEAVFSATVNYNDSTPNGATRAIAGWQGFWDGKSRLLELSFSQSENWGDNHPAHADIVNIVNSPTLQFIHLDGAAMGITTKKGVDTELDIAWHAIIADLVQRGFVDAPAQGWDQTATQAVFVGHETHSFSATNSVAATLRVTNFRVEHKAEQP